MDDGDSCEMGSVREEETVIRTSVKASASPDLWGEKEHNKLLGS